MSICVTVGVSGPQGAPGAPGAVFNNVLNATVSETLTQAQNATLFNNIGATAEIDLTLPAAPSPFVPMSFTLLVAAAQNFAFVAPAGVTISNGADSSSSGGSITSNTVGNMATVALVSPTQWVVTSITGLWNLS